MHAPRIDHWDAALCTVQYLKGTPGQGILLCASSDLSLSGWCDSDWASCPLTRRSLTGWVVFLGSSLISRKTKKQHTVSRSSAEAEYRSMAAVTSELKWLRALLSDLAVSHSSPMQLYCDSQSALHIAQNPVSMNALSISRLTVIIFEMRFMMVSLLLLTFLPPINVPIFSLRPLVPVSFIFFLASWAFVICMLQLRRGGC